jgi:tRNA dimethylallyltransferase
MLVAIVGATGTGKSALSLDLAGALASHGHTAEIVNADAMQLYRGMDIGTAKLPVADRRGVPHHLLDVLEVTEDASVARYQGWARDTVQEILGRGAVPILVGGSGLYVSSVLYDFRFPGTDAAVRGRLEAELAAGGPGALHDRLTAVDPIAAASIGPFNGRRIVRALEVVELTGAPFGAGLSAQARTWMPTTILGLRAPRSELVTRLDERVRGMWRDGLLDEVRSLLPLGIEHAATAGQAIGYAQAIAQLSGRLEEAEAIELTSALTRRYARRQVGWFRREKLTNWLDYDDSERTDRAVQLVLSNG